MKNISIFPLLLMCSFLPIKQGFTQTLPSCVSSSSDSDGDGYGWENGESCIVISHDGCEDRGDYPWGWNPVTLESCRIDAVADVCVDTEPLNDGWGWDGVTSCRVSIARDLHRCDDLGNYPWGWNPTTETSCRLDLVETPEFPIDTVTYTGPLLPRVSVDDVMDVDLLCKRVKEDYYCNCDNSVTDWLADVQEIEDLFFTATLRAQNEVEIITDGFSNGFYQAIDIEGTWKEHRLNPRLTEVPVYRDIYNLRNDGTDYLVFDSTNGISAVFSGLLRFYESGDDVFIEQRNFLAGGDDVESLAHCVVR